MLIENKVLLVGFNFHFHDKNSGYGRMLNYFPMFKTLDYTGIYAGDKYCFMSGVLRRFLCEFITILYALNVKVVHYIYPEGTVFFSPLILKYLFRKKIVFTLHLKPDWFRKSFSDDRFLKRYIRKLFQWITILNVNSVDCCIALTDESAESYREYFNCKKFRVIPHGIVPSNRSTKSVKKIVKKQIEVCVVGSNYRDWKFINDFLTCDGSKQFRTHLIGVDFNKIVPLDGEHIVNHKKRINNDEYINILNDSLFMLLPLTYATANNAILEAYQHKIFVITTSAGINRNYLLNTLIEVDSPKNAIDQINYISDFACKNPEVIQSILDDAFIKSLSRFSWENLRESYCTIYAEIM